MNELKRARLMTFVVLFIAIEAIVAGALFFYHGIQKDTIDAQVGGLADQAVKQTRDQVRQTLDVFEGITQQILLNPQMRKDIVGTQSASYDPVELIRATTRISDELTALRFMNKNIVNIRLISKENYENVKEVTNALFQTANTNTINLFDQNKEGLRGFIQAGGEPVWVSTLKNGFFYPPDMEETKYFPGYTITLGRLLKNAAKPQTEMVAVMEIESKVLNQALANVKIGNYSFVSIIDSSNNTVIAADPKAGGQPTIFPVPKGHQSGMIFDDGIVRVLAEPLGKPDWYVAVGYKPSEYTSYIDSTFKLLLMVISVIVLVVSAGLAWVMNRE